MAIVIVVYSLAVQLQENYFGLGGSLGRSDPDPSLSWDPHKNGRIIGPQMVEREKVCQVRPTDGVIICPIKYC